MAFQRIRLPAPDAARVTPSEPEPARSADTGFHLPGPLRRSFETALGADLAGVQLHTGPRADASARGLDATAFTFGPDVYFRKNAYQPATEQGRRLIAHEMAHVMQQRAAGPPAVDVARGRAFIARHSAALLRPSAVPRAPLIQRTLHPVPLVDRRYVDDRWGHVLEKIGSITYRDTTTDDYYFYEVATDQFVDAGNTDRYYDPQRNQYLLHLFGQVYENEAEDQAYFYDGHLYLPVAQPLVNFAGEVWRNRATIAGRPTVKSAIDWIYTQLYERASGQVPPHISLGGPVAGLAQLAVQRGAHLQGSQTSIKDLWRAWTEDKDVGAFEKLAKGYYYFRFREGAFRSRVVLNVAAASVHTEFKKLLPVLQAFEIVVDAKVAGPTGCQRNLDCIVIYLSTTNAEQIAAFTEALHEIGVEGVGENPALLAPVRVGVATGHEPPQVEGRSISFGQKRSILAYHALTLGGGADATWAEFFPAFLRQFTNAGVNLERPNEETGGMTLLSSQLLKQYLDVISPV